MSLQLNVIISAILVSCFAYSATPSFTCVNANKRVALQVSFKNLNNQLVAYAQLSTRSGRPLQTTTEKFKLVKASVQEQSGVKFEELMPKSYHHSEAYQYPHRNLQLPGYLFTSSPRRKFQAELENYDVESLRSKWEYLSCQLN